MKNRRNFFGIIDDEKIYLDDFGIMVNELWNEIPKHYPNVILDDYVIMPDHIHGILIINKNKIINVGVDPRVDPLGIIVKKFKTLTTKIFADKVNNNNWPKFDKRLWQRNYYERIIRNEKEYLKIKEYIKNNPKN